MNLLDSRLLYFGVIVFFLGDSSAESATAESKGLVICWTVSRTDENAVGIEFVSIEKFAITATIVEKSGKVSRIPHALIREEVEFPNLSAADLITPGDLAKISDLKRRYTTLREKYPNATDSLTPLLNSIVEYEELLNGGDVRYNGSWMRRSRYEALQIEMKQKEAAQKKAKLESLTQQEQAARLREEGDVQAADAERKEQERQFAAKFKAERKVRDIALQEESQRLERDARALRRVNRQELNLARRSGNPAEAVAKSGFTARMLTESAPGLPSPEQIFQRSGFSTDAIEEIGHKSALVAKLAARTSGGPIAIIVTEDETTHTTKYLQFVVILSEPNLDGGSDSLKGVSQTLRSFDPRASDWLPSALVSGSTKLQLTKNRSSHPLVVGGSGSTSTEPAVIIRDFGQGRRYRLTMSNPVLQTDGVVAQAVSLEVLATVSK